MPLFSRPSLHHSRLIPLFSYIQRSSFVEGAKMKWVRERGLDHAVEKEMNLKPLLSLKNLIISEPSKSLPLAVASELKSQLSLPSRAIDFFRKYPSVFLECPSPSPDPRPRIALTPDAIHLHEEEQSLYNSSKHDIANRLLRLLMLTPNRKLPLTVVDRLKFDLGLPNDYSQSILPDFPDYFLVSPLHLPAGRGTTLALELVCYNKDLAMSVMETRAESQGEYKKGMPLAFPLQFSKGFDMEKKVKKWMEEWQKLPYISPYEDGWHLAPKSDLGEKWAVGVLHEILHLLVPKKTEKENLLVLGECMGLRSRFKRALADYPGIFYVSNKIRTNTVVLREAYKRNLLVEKHPLMGMRYHYIHLMNKGKEVRVEGSASHGKLDNRVHPKTEEDYDDIDENESGEDDEEEEGGGSSDFENEDETDSDDEDEDDHHKSVPVNRGMRQIRQQQTEIYGRARSAIQERSTGRHLDRRGKDPATFSKKTKLNREPSKGVRSSRRPSYPQGSEKTSSNKNCSGY